MPLCTSLIAAGCSMQIIRWSGMSIQGHERAWRELDMWIVGGAVAAVWAWEAIVGLGGKLGGEWRSVSLSGGGQGNKKISEVSTAIK